MLLIPCQNYSFFGWTRLYWLNDSAICQEQVIKMDSVSKPIRFWKPYWFIKSRHHIKHKFYKRLIPSGLNHKNEPLFFSPRRGEVFFAFPAGKDGMGQKNKHYCSIIISYPGDSIIRWIINLRGGFIPSDAVWRGGWLYHYLTTINRAFCPVAGMRAQYIPVCHLLMSIEFSYPWYTSEPCISAMKTKALSVQVRRVVVMCWCH